LIYIYSHKVAYKEVTGRLKSSNKNKTILPKIENKNYSASKTEIKSKYLQPSNNSMDEKAFL
jgi:hypothetical protein